MVRIRPLLFPSKSWRNRVCACLLAQAFGSSLQRLVGIVAAAPTEAGWAAAGGADHAAGRPGDVHTGERHFAPFVLAWHDAWLRAAGSVSLAPGDGVTMTLRLWRSWRPS